MAQPDFSEPISLNSSTNSCSRRAISPLVTVSESAARRGRPRVVQAAVEDVQFFTNLADALEPWRLFRAGIPDRLKIFFKQIDQRARLRPLHKLKSSTCVFLREFEIYDVLVDLIFVATKGHAHLVEPDISAQRFHLLDGFHVKLFGFFRRAATFLDPAKRVVALI